MCWVLFLLLSVASVAISAAASTSSASSNSPAQLLNKQVKRALLLSADKVREDLAITFVNVGDLPQEWYAFVIPDHLPATSLTASSPNGDSLRVDAGRDGAMHVREARIKLPTPVHHGQSMTINVQVGYEASLAACPKYSTMHGPATFRVTHSALFYSEYPTQRQRTYIKFAEQLRLKSFACASPYDEKDKYCGTYVDVGKKMVSPLTVKVEHRAGPSFRVRRVQRTYEISADGKSVRVCESVELKHTGPLLANGDFNRAELGKLIRLPVRDSSPIVTQLRLRIPKGSRQFRIEDRLGLNWNHLRQPSDSRESAVYAFQPRFPVLSGWEYPFTYSYVASLEHFRVGKGIVRLPMTDLVYNTQTGSATVRIVLPEDAKVKDVDAHGGKLAVSKTRSFLSTLGQTVLHVDFFAVNPTAQTSAVTVELEIPVWAKLRKPLIGVVVAMAVITLIGKAMGTDSERAKVSKLLDKRKQLVLNGTSVCKIDSEILALCSDSPPRVQKVKKALDGPADHTQVDAVHSNLLLSLFE